MTDDAAAAVVERLRAWVWWRDVKQSRPPLTVPIGRSIQHSDVTALLDHLEGLQARLTSFSNLEAINMRLCEQGLDWMARVHALEADLRAVAGALRDARKALYLVLTASDMGNAGSPHLPLPKIYSIVGAACPEQPCEHRICGAIRNADKVFTETGVVVQRPGVAGLGEGT